MFVQNENFNKFNNYLIYFYIIIVNKINEIKN